MQLNGKVFAVLVICLALVTLVAEPKQKGFDCGDQSIRRPFIALQISLQKLLAFCIAIPIFVAIVTESLTRSGRKVPVKSAIKKNVMAFMFGLLINFVAVMSAKNIFGRLRPHTIQFCNASHYCSEGIARTHLKSHFISIIYLKEWTTNTSNHSSVETTTSRSECRGMFATVSIQVTPLWPSIRQFFL